MLFTALLRCFTLTLSSHYCFICCNDNDYTVSLLEARRLFICIIGELFSNLMIA